MKLYFAYGSNMDPQRIQKRINRLPSRESAVLIGYKLYFNKKADGKPGIGYANIMLTEGESVYGILYQVTECELSKIDCHEGVYTGHYSRQEVTVLLEDKQEINAITYIACPDKIRNKLVPEKSYLAHLLAGKAYLPEEYVCFLESHSMATTINERGDT